MPEENEMGSRISEIFLGILACYVGYFIIYQKGWDFVHDQPVPKFVGLIVMSFGIGLIFFSSYKAIKLIKDNKSHRTKTGTL